ncbi:PAN2-PAN3 deadenylation complex subunit PAN3 [Physcia stellaris]|nr:PAN2-PAN3 deadenylation complex subunit PAN3 [Physcia stellaris]
MAEYIDANEPVTVEGLEQSLSLTDGTAEDKYDMTRIGKKQELRRNFHFISIMAFMVMVVNTWATILYTISYGLIDGGLAGLVWMFLFAACGMATVTLSLAEMASMAPTSGGQYHWASEFAPRSIQKSVSYINGWLATLSWQTGTASASYVMASQIQGLLILNYSNYEFERWHGTLLIITIASLATVCNIMFARLLPQIETLVFALYMATFVGIITTLWVLGPKTPAKVVFTEFQNNGGWSNQGLSVLIGLTGPVYSLIALDCGVHLGEEVRDASRTLPLALVWTYTIGAISGFIMMVTFCFSVGDISEAVESPTGQAYIQVFYTATKSRGGATAMSSIVTLLTFFNGVNNIASASRQMYAFARDNGLPFSSYLSYVKPGRALPLNSIITSFIVTILLSLINIGSTVAYNAIVSLGAAALFTTYFISIACLLHRRLRGEPLRPRRWSLGRWGAPLNVAAVLFLSVAYFFSFWPLFTPTTATTFNWSVVIYVAVVVFAAGYYLGKGRFVYVGPVALVKRDL